MRFLLKWASIIFGGLFVIGLIGNALKSPEERAADQAASVVVNEIWTLV